MPTSGKPIENLAEALRERLPRACGRPRCRRGARLSGRRRGARPAARSGRAPTSTWSSRATPATLAATLGAETVEHERFGTAKVRLDGHEVDIAAARTETYAQPGALPRGRARERIADDLARRDFTINAMAIPLRGEPRADRPPRRPRRPGGRPAASPAPGLLRRRPDPGAARRPLRGPLRLRAGAGDRRPAAATPTSARSRPTGARRSCCGSPAEAEAARGFELLDEWGLVELREGGVELAGRVAELLRLPPWRGVAARERTVLAAALGPACGEVELAAARPARPSEAVELAGGRDPVELVLARAMGAEWLDRYLAEWRSVALEIDGEDLIAAGVPQGPARGPRPAGGAAPQARRGARRAASEELAVALEAARAG